MWDLIVSVPEYCLSYYFSEQLNVNLTFAKMNCESLHLATLQIWSDFYISLKVFFTFFSETTNHKTCPHITRP